MKVKIINFEKNGYILIPVELEEKYEKKIKMLTSLNNGFKVQTQITEYNHNLTLQQNFYKVE